MTLTTIGLIALLVPLALVGVLFVLYRIAEMTRVSKTTRWVIGGAALLASLGLAIWDVANGGSAWNHMVTGFVWVSLIFMFRHQTPESNR